MTIKVNKNLFYLLFFLFVMGLTMYTMLKGNDITAILLAISSMKIGYFFLAMLVALLFVILEAVIIWYLMRSLGEPNSILRCAAYSFIGYFYSAITPAALPQQSV